MTVYSFRQYAIRCDTEGCTETSWENNTAAEAIADAEIDGWIRTDGKWTCPELHGAARDAARAAHLARVHPVDELLRPLYQSIAENMNRSAAEISATLPEGVYAKFSLDPIQLDTSIFATQAFYRTGPQGE